MSFPLSMLYDAVFATPETYRQRYVVPQKKLFASTDVAVKKPDADGELENRLFISGGKRTPRMRVLNGAISQQLEKGRAVVLIQPAGVTYSMVDAQFLQSNLSPMDGSYDPFYGYSIDNVVDMLIKSAIAEGFSTAEAADLTHAITDEIDYLAATQNMLSLGEFVHTSSRKIGEDAFNKGNDRLTESHAECTINARIDRLRLLLRRLCQFSPSGKSIAASVTPGTVTVLKLPQNSPAWMAIALHELNSLQVESNLDVFPLFVEIYISETCQPLLEKLSGGRCFCYQDLPALGWLWSVATTASSTGCLLKHVGTSAQIISDYFGKQQVKKMARTVSSGRSNCDSGGFMGIFGATTLSSSHSCTISYDWEPAIPDGVIRDLDDDEGIFFYQNMNKTYRINI